jgi:hypothetical protein
MYGPGGFSRRKYWSKPVFYQTRANVFPTGNSNPYPEAIYIYWHMLNACKSTSLPPEVFDLGPPGQVVANAGGSWGDPADVSNDAKVQLTLERKGRSKGF